MIVRNAAANAAGVVVPALVAIAATPMLIRVLGSAVYGMLSLQLAVLILFGVNDFGISRAIVLVAVGEGGFASPAQRAATVEAGLQLSMTLGTVLLAASFLVIGTARAIVPSSSDIVISSLLTVASASLSLLTLPLRASMEVEERFVLLNVWRTVATALLFLAPLGAALIQPTLTATAIGLLLSRILVLGGYLRVARAVDVRHLLDGFPAFLERLRHRQIGPLHRLLLRRGGWLGLAGLISTFIGYSDRFVLGAIGTAADVGHYVVASELVTKLWLIVGALTIAATPRLAAAWERPESNDFGRLFPRYYWAVAGIAVMSHAFLIGVGDAFLKLWLGHAGYAPIIAQVMKILSIGISLNCMSQTNATLVNIARRERSGATVQMIFLPVTIGLLAAGVWLAGPVGAAWALTLRLVIDAFVFRYVVHRQVGAAGRHGVRTWQLGAMLVLLLAIYFADRWLRW